jgi:hypothetical protein
MSRPSDSRGVDYVLVSLHDAMTLTKWGKILLRASGSQADKLEGLGFSHGVCWRNMVVKGAGQI